MNSRERGISHGLDGERSSRTEFEPEREPRTESRQALPEDEETLGGTIYSSSTSEIPSPHVLSARLEGNPQRSLQSLIETPQFHIPMLRRRHFPGEEVQAQAYDIFGRPLGETRFRVERHPGSGFAGQVDMASVEPAADGLPKVVALKAMRPTSGPKEMIRDSLFLSGYEAPFLARTDEIAVRRGLIVQELVKKAAGIYFGNDEVAAKPIGYYFDPTLGSFVEIHEYVEGRPTLLEPQMPGRTRELDQKSWFQHQFTRLLKQMGLSDLSRQYEWWTLLSQPNVIKRKNGLLTALDFRQGIATIIPLSPHDLVRYISDLLHLRSPIHFDHIDLEKMRKFVWGHETMEALFETLEPLDEEYRQALNFRRRSRQVFVDSWYHRGLVSETAGERLERFKRFWRRQRFDELPIEYNFSGIAERVFRFLANGEYRRHAVSVLTDGEYRSKFFRVLRAQNIQGWLESGEISEKQLDGLLENAVAFWRFKLGRLPVRKVGEKFEEAVVDPVRLIFNSQFRKEWMADRIEEALLEGTIDKDTAEELKSEIEESKAQEYLRDNLTVVGIGVVTKLSIPAAALATYFTGDLIYAGYVTLAPAFTPSGILRTAYYLGRNIADIPRTVRERDWRLKERSLIATTLPIRFLGNGVLLAAMGIRHPEFTQILVKHLAQKSVNKVPVFGQKGGLLEAWAFDLAYSLPLGIARRFGLVK